MRSPSLCNALVLALGVSALAPSAWAQSTTIVKPEFLLIVDTSGSMTQSTGTGTNSCGYTRRRINDAACVVRNIADGVGDAIFGLETFAMNCSNTGCHYSATVNGSCGSVNCGALSLPGYPYPFIGCENSAQVQVNIGEGMAWELRTWGDGAWTSCANPSGLTPPMLGGNELSNAYNTSCPGAAVSATPLAGSLRVAWMYLTNRLPGRTSPYIDFNGTGQVDPYPACRPVNVILLTDGGETCVTGGATAATQNAYNIGCLQVDLNRNGVIENPIPNTDPNPTLRGKYESNIDLNGDRDCYDPGEQRAFRTRVYTIGFGVGCPDSSIESIATGGGVQPHRVSCTASMVRGYYAQTETDISDAINDIIAQSALRELCNGTDDDCDGQIDEDYAVGPRAMPCTVGVGACQRTGTTVCNSTQDGVTCNATPGTPGSENTVTTCSNGIDDDCDGFIDCGDPNCATQPNCTGACTPSPEVCDGRDNDCDGQIDEGGITRPCGSNIGTCTTGTQTCQQQTPPGSGTGIWSACTGRGPTPEVCDGLDNNCNGVADEGLSRPCGSSVGTCRPGIQQCIGGTYSGPCIGEVPPSTEICDGLDNDCDGRTDEDIPPGGSCGASGVGVCTAGTIQCVGGRLVCVGGTMPGPETCNGLDDDCNGIVDDGIASTRCTPPGITIPTDAMGNPIGTCRFGTTACRGGRTVCEGAIGPSTEVCDGLDNDCDGMVDEDIPSTPCGSSVGACRPGTLRCVMGRPVCEGSTSPMPEICDGLDNDCDGEVDEGNPGGGTSCGESRGECAPGVLECRGGRLVCVGGREPSAEVCDGLDNDCDGMVDEDIPPGGPCGSSVGACRPGTLRCVAGRMVCEGSIGPRPEECNCQDDDCNGMVDDMATGGSPLCASGSVCAGAPHCACLRPCASGEFPCPSGRTCENVGGQRLCVGDPCANVRCNPETERCVNGECRNRCAGVMCEAGLVCDPRSGRCVANDCRILQNCSDGQICRNGTCQPDPCASVTCPEGQACYEGTCGVSCANVTCRPGETCIRGVCQTGNRCTGVTCPTGQVCDPSNGQCTADLCGNRSCGRDQICNPVTGNCEDDPCAVVRCPAGQTCVRGECTYTMDGGIDGRRTPPRDRVIGSGGGGMICTASPTVGHHSHARGVLLTLTFMGAALVTQAIRRRRDRSNSKEVQG